MQNRNILRILFMMLMLFALSVGVMAQDDDSDVTDEPGDGVNLDFPEIDPFDPNAYVRFAHLAPGVGDVDIYLNGQLAGMDDDFNMDLGEMAGVGYEALGPWITLAPGGYDIDVVAAGDDMMNAVIDIDSFNFPRGQWTTVAVVNNDNEGTPAVVTAVEDFSEPLPGVTNVTFLNALSYDGDVDFYRDGIPFVMGLGDNANEINSYSYAIPMDTAAYNFSANQEIGDDVLAADADVELTEWSSYLVVAYGDEQGNARLLIDETPRVEYALLRGTLPGDGTVVDALRGIDELQPYARMIDYLGLTDDLAAEGPFTIFIPAGFLADEILIVAFEDRELLGQILAAHIYEGAILESNELIDLDSLVMSNGNEIPVIVEDNKIYVGGAEVIDVNIPAVNGIIHVIGYVIDPTLDQEDYDLFDDAANLFGNADVDVIEDLQSDIEDEDEED